jgi:hypothetical protein
MRLHRFDAAAADSRQLLCVTVGSGWVAGADGIRAPITAGQAAAFERGEAHETGTETGLTAIVLEGDGFSVWAPPADPPPTGAVGPVSR